MPPLCSMRKPPGHLRSSRIVLSVVAAVTLSWTASAAFSVSARYVGQSDARPAQQRAAVKRMGCLVAGGPQHPRFVSVPGDRTCAGSGTADADRKDSASIFRGIVLKRALFVAGMYLFFFKSTHIIDTATSAHDWLEAPVYMLLAAIVFWQLGTDHVEEGVSVLFLACATRCPSPIGKHFFVNLIQPMSKLVKAMLAFFAINTMVNAFPSSFAWKPPKQWDFLSYLFGAAAMADGVLTATEIETAFRKRSVLLLYAVVVSCIGWYVHKVKQPPNRLDNSRETSFLTWYWTALTNRRGLAPLVDFAIGGAVVGFTAVAWMNALGINARAVLAFGGIGGLAFGLAAQNLVSNLISGLLVLATNPFKNGDFITTSSVQGHVRSVGWNFTTIETREGSMIYVPNGSVLSDTTNNRTGGDTRLATVSLPVRFPGGGFDRIDELIEGIKAVTANCPEISDLVVGQVRVLFKGIDISENPLPILDVEVRLDNTNLQSIRGMKSAMTLALVQYLRGAGCTVPGLEGPEE